MIYSVEEKVKWLAIISRTVILTLQILLNAVIPDHNAGVFKKPFDGNSTITSSDKAIDFLLEGLSRWDAQYFLHIAQYGYTYENTLAFFPFYPLVVRQIAVIILYIFNSVFIFFIPWIEPISIHSSLLLTAVIVNNLIFVKAAIILYNLSLTILKNKKLSYISSVLFCINPASIFFSAVYSESLYCFLIFYGLLRIEEKKFFLGSILIGLSGMTRSNGIINIGFICYGYVKMKIDRKLSFRNDVLFSVCFILSILPFALYQLYCYFKYCFPSNVSPPEFIQSYGIEKEFKFPGNGSEWCKYSIPFAYSFVQSYYWNVGFLQYYQFKQLPNFMLAFPAILIVLCGCLAFARQLGSSIFYLGFKTPSHPTELPVSIYVYVVHCLSLTIFSILMIHIQVTTRLLFSSTPVVYWFSAWFLSDGVSENVSGFVMRKFRKNDFIESTENRRSKWKTFLLSERYRGTALLVKYYYITYFLLGTLMFSNFLPWT